MRQTTATALLFAFIQGWLVRAQGLNIPCRMYSVEEYHEHALKTLEPKSMRYIDEVAGNGDTHRWNEEAFRRIRFSNKVLVNVSQRSLSTTLLGSKVSFPVAIAPAAAHQNAHPDGENATARASASAGVLMALGTYSTVPLEEVVAAGGPNLLRWMTIEFYPNLTITLDLIRRGEAAGVKAIVATVDVAVDGYRPTLLKDGEYWFPNGSRWANFDKFPDFDFVDDTASTWNNIRWLNEQTELPIVIKGILTADDAKLAVKHGAKGIIVSNHGGRQLDGDPPTIEVLPKIVKAVKGKAEVYLDSGVRSGMDVLKALALGARAVFIGRPLFYGLSYQGEVGLKCVLDLLKYQLDNVMALTGQTDVTAIAKSVIRKPTVNYDCFL